MEQELLRFGSGCVFGDSLSFLTGGFFIGMLGSVYHSILYIHWSLGVFLPFG